MEKNDLMFHMGKKDKCIIHQNDFIYIYIVYIYRIYIYIFEICLTVTHTHTQKFIYYMLIYCI